MDWLHGILNLIGLLFWILWRAGTIPRPKPRNSITGPMPRPGPISKHSWIYLVALIGLLGLRTVFYHQFGPGLDWIPRLNLLDIHHPFNSDSLPHALAFSVLSFGHWLTALYFCFALLSTVQPQSDATDLWRKFLKAQFSALARLPVFIQWLLVIALTFGLRFGEANWIQSLETVETPINHLPLIVLLDLRTAVYLIMALLGLYLLNSYVYFGEQTFWKMVDESGKRLLMPMRFLSWEAGKIDFAPIAALAIVYGLSHALTPAHMAQLLR